MINTYIMILDSKVVDEFHINILYIVSDYTYGIVNTKSFISLAGNIHLNDRT